MPNLTQQIAETVTSVGVHAAYGAPVEIDGTTIVPVAVVSYGFGAGEGDAAGRTADVLSGRCAGCGG